MLEDEVEAAEAEVPPSVMLKESTSSFSKIGSVQLEKIKKIDQEIKFIRERLNNNQKQAGLKESYNSVEMKDMRRQLGKPLESKAGEGKEVKESANPNNKNNNNNYYR